MINFSDLSSNNLQIEKIIEKLENILDDKEKFKIFDNLLWELYVRRRQLLNDPGNNLVKTIESTEEFFVNFGMKQGQTKKSPQPEETPQEKPNENPTEKPQ